MDEQATGSNNLTVSKPNRGRSSILYRILALILLFTLAIAAFFVGRWYEQQHPTQSFNSNTQQTATKSASASQSASLPTQKYFTIKEWGVRAPYNGSDTLTYSLQFGDTFAKFTSKQLTAADPACASDGGAIQRRLPTSIMNPDGTGPTVEQYSKQHPGAFTYVNGYYYQFFHDQASCSSTIGGLQQEVNLTVQSFVTNFQAVPSN